MKTEKITTGMVRNLPEACTSHEVRRMLAVSGFDRLYDYLYIPHDFKTGNSKGVAFINFIYPDAYIAFKNSWHGSRWFPESRENRGLQIKEAHIQGSRANALKAAKCAETVRNESFRPFFAGNLKTYPPPR